MIIISFFLFSLVIITLLLSTRQAFMARRDRLYWRICAGLLWLGVACLIAKLLVGSTVDAEGVLHEPFFLLPFAYFCIFLGILMSILIIIWRNINRG
jgi:Protein of unknown function (DUF3955)